MMSPIGDITISGRAVAAGHHPEFVKPALERAVESGTRRDGCRRMSFGSRMSAVKKWQRQPG
jgi:hypothetical protein